MYYYFNKETNEINEVDRKYLTIEFIEPCLDKNECYGPSFWYDDETGYIMKITESGERERLYNRPFCKTEAEIELEQIALFYIEKNELPVFRTYSEAVDFALRHMRDKLAWLAS